jgi:hypothetical protein
MNNFSNINRPRSINECAHLIATVGAAITVVVRGEPGTGKSSIQRMLEERFPDYASVELDCPTLGDGDLGTNIPVHDSKQLEFYVASLLRLDEGKPLILQLDEWLKTSKLMKTMFTRLILNREIGGRKLPEGSIVYATSNLATDGVNDTKGAHEQNRVLEIEMAKPDHKELSVYMVNKGISPILRTWINLVQKVLHSYRTITADQLANNELIWNPSKPVTAFASPRSIVGCDPIIKNRKVLGDALCEAALAGMMGAPAARSLMSFVQMEKDIVPVPTILHDPENAHLPDDAGPLLLTLFHAADELQNQDELTKFLKYTARISNEEYRAVFFSMMCEAKRTHRMAMQNAVLKKWYQENYELVN